MNSEESKKENNNYRKYIWYFFCAWLSFLVLSCFLFKLAGQNIADSAWDWFFLFFIPAVLALGATPLIALAVKKGIVFRVKAYFKRFLFPVYLFPIKLMTYSLFYLVQFIFGLIVSLLKIIWDFVSFPFRSLKNFLKSLCIIALVAYMAVSSFVNIDYLNTHYGYYKKFFTCKTYGVNEKIRNSVVRVVGGHAEGSGFFIQPNQIVTNFHVIAGESSPKIIFPDGSFIVPEKIIGDKDRDLAIIFTKQEYPNMVMNFVSGVENDLYEDEALFATGYALGTDLLGDATQLRGSAIGVKKMSGSDFDFIQTSISLAGGMSGGPLTDLCGTVVGVNTKGVGGVSLFIPVFENLSSTNKFTDEDIKKIEFNPAASPEEAVKAFYNYLKERRMEDSFNLLSEEYVKNTSLEEWSSRFENVIDVDVIKSEKYENTKDTALVKFSTRNWVDGEVSTHYYEGTWTMVKENGVFKIQKGKILEISNPEIYWFYE